MYRYLKAGLEKFNRIIITFLRKVDIFKRLLLAFTTLLLVSSGFIALFSFYNYSKEVEKNIQRYISLLAQNITMKVEDTIAAYESNALDFYGDPDIIAALQRNAGLPDAEHRSQRQQDSYEKDRAFIERKLFSVWGNRKDVVNIQFITPREQYYMVNPYGYRRGGCVKDLKKFYASPFYTVPQERQGYPVWFDTPEQSETFYKSEQSVYGIGNTVTLCVGVYDINADARSFLGVLVFNIDVKAFSGAGEGYASYNDGNTFLVGESGVLLWFNPSLDAPSFPKNDGLYQEMEQKRQGIIETGDADGTLFLSYQSVDGTDFFVVHLVQKSRLFADTYRIRNLCIAVLAGVVIACFVVSYYVTISISNPVSRLIQVMKKTGAGKWNARYRNSGRDEITILGTKFNEMTDKTDQLIAQVYRSEIRRREALLSQKNAELDALQMQINPHFLYNTLDIIRWETMYEAGEESSAARMIETFSQLYRMGTKTGRNTISLEAGLEHAITYLKVINFRHEEKIELTVRTDLDASLVYIPQFTLQPIMENAVVHGFGEASSGYRIEIHSFECGSVLYIQVSDNGKGMTREEENRLLTALEKESWEEGSIGLRNVNRRIKLFYGDEYGVKIKNLPGEGAVVTVMLPVRNYSEDMEQDAGE